MAEWLGDKLEHLIAFCSGIKEKRDGRALYEKYLSDIVSITPSELFLVMNEQLKRGVPVPEMLTYVDKLINVFARPLAAYPWPKPKRETFLYLLMRENAELIRRLQRFKSVIKSNDRAQIRADLPALIHELNRYHVHMQKLENLLFPYLERKDERFLGLKALWALHDEARSQLKKTYALLENEQIDERDFNIALGRLYFLLYGLIEKQELVLFPAASEALTDADFSEMHAQSFEYGFAYIDRPMPLKDTADGETKKSAISELVSVTGRLSMQEMKAILNTLPLDMTLIDADDKVKFFSRPKKRVFQRSPAIIGRDVRNCHPPKSVHIVERILKAFKEGRKDSAKFWIQMNGLFVVIEYFALRSDTGAYLGTLETSQEVSDIRALSGEQRLLDWSEQA